jgi:superfamily II DNA or RNA helicase
MNKIKPRPYQQEVIDNLRNSYRSGKKHPLIVMPTGAGKACVLGFVVENAAAKNNETLVIAHRQELIFQLSLTLCNFGIEHNLIAAASTISAIKMSQYKSFGKVFWNPKAKVHVGSVQTVKSRVSKLDISPRLIITDECFPAGTMIDGRPVESLKIGDMVFSINHSSGMFERKRITKLFRSRPSSLVKVNLSSGEHIICTAGHPFFIPNFGYYNAIDLKKGMQLLYMQKDSSAEYLVSEKQVQEHWSGVLQQSMLDGVSEKDFVRNNGENQQEVRIRQNEAKKPDVQEGDTRESIENPKRVWIQAADPWRKWTGDDGSTTHSKGGFNRSRSLCEGGVYSKDWRIQAPIPNPKSLQNRLSARDEYGGNRNRWEQSRYSCEKRAGREKNKGSGIVRVESVEVFERGCFEQSRELLPDGYVYNIEVEDNHNYFANGILVHNCHHVSDGNQWGSIYDAFPSSLGLGLTASPRRTDGKGLGAGFGGYCDDMIIGPQMSWLIEQGFLSPYKVYTTGKQLDTSGVKKKRNGEFDEKSLSEITDKPSIIGDAITHYKQLCNGLSGVCYCVSIDHSKHVASMFTENGIPAAHVDGTMDDSERRKIFTDYADGVIKIICNQSIISEGTDLESLTQRKGVTLDVCIDLAPTQSLIVAMQRWGRVLRNKSGKVAYIIDHASNVLRHGLPDMDREWSLEGEIKTSKNDGEKTISVRTCPQCFHIHLPEPQCPDCSFIYPQQVRVVDEKEGELVELTEDDKAAIKYQMKWDKRKEQSKAESLEDLIELGRKRGYKDGWAHKMWAARQAKKAS